MGSFHSATRIKISDDTRAVVDITKAITSADAKMFKLVSGKSIASFVKKVMKIDGMTTEEKNMLMTNRQCGIPKSMSDSRMLCRQRQLHSGP